jgi:pyruvate/2-oxoglutarate dehydrogenase complex dihydrolipoamide dehydrogenase (E3) component
MVASARAAYVARRAAEFGVVIEELEFGQMFRRFGSGVTIVERMSRLIGQEDDDVSVAVMEILENEGVEIRRNANCIALAKDDGGVRVRVDCESGEPEIAGSHLLMAVGRRPKTDELGLERAGVEMANVGIFGSMMNYSPTSRTSGHWAMSTAGAPLPTPHTMITRLWLIIY